MEGVTKGVKGSRSEIGFTEDSSLIGTLLKAVSNEFVSLTMFTILSIGSNWASFTFASTCVGYFLNSSTRPFGESEAGGFGLSFSAEIFYREYGTAYQIWSALPPTSSKDGLGDGIYS